MKLSYLLGFLAMLCVVLLATPTRSEEISEEDLAPELPESLDEELLLDEENREERSSCYVPGKGSGVCQYTYYSCSGGSYSAGYCPGASNIQCCVRQSTPPPSPPPSTGTACTVPSAGRGVCQYTYNSCAGRYHAGYCPGASNIQCCVSQSTPPPSPPPSTGTACTVPNVGRGVCQYTYNSCAGRYHAGHCPGASNVQCCVASSAPPPTPPPSPPPTGSGTTVCTNAPSGLNIRSGAGTNYGAKWVSPHSQQFTVLNGNGQWWNIRALNGPSCGQDGWAMSQYLTRCTASSSSCSGTSGTSGSGTSGTSGSGTSGTSGSSSGSTSGGGSGRVDFRGITISDADVRRQLQLIANLYPSSYVQVTSGNRNNGGRSHHDVGRAADFLIPGVPCSQIFERIRSAGLMQTDYQIIWHGTQTCTTREHMHIGRYTDGRRSCWAIEGTTSSNKCDYTCR